MQHKFVVVGPKMFTGECVKSKTIIDIISECTKCTMYITTDPENLAVVLAGFVFIICYEFKHQFLCVAIVVALCSSRSS